MNELRNVYFINNEMRHIDNLKCSEKKPIVNITNQDLYIQYCLHYQNSQIET